MTRSFTALVSVAALAGCAAPHSTPKSAATPAPVSSSVTSEAPVAAASPATSPATSPLTPEPRQSVPAAGAVPPALTPAVPAAHLPFPGYGQVAVYLEGAGLLGESGTVTKPHATASVAKVMDAYQVLTDHPLSATESGPTITVQEDEYEAYYAERNSGQTLVPVYAGEKITERQALEAMLLPSANDIARILARWDAGSIEEFLVRENAMAAKLGMTHTHFTDPAGVDSGTVSTAPDLVKLDVVAMRLPAFAKVVSEKSASVPAAGTVTNMNHLLGLDGVIGTKTGWTAAAGACLMFTAKVKGGDGAYHMVYGVILGTPGSIAGSADVAAANARKLVDAARTYALAH